VDTRRTLKALRDATLGAALASFPAALYFVTRQWELALATYPWAAVSAAIVLVAVRRRRSLLAASCALVIPLSVLAIRADIARLERFVRSATDEYRAAGIAAIRASESTCPTLSTSLGTLYRCEVDQMLLPTQRNLGARVEVVAEQGGQRRALFSLRRGSRMVVAVVPGSLDYPCEALGQDVYLCGFRK
jgi:hypothetical protein